MPLPLVLISTPIDLGKIKLGNLVPNISQPHFDAFEPYTLPDDAIHVSEQVYAVVYRRIGFKWFASKNVDSAFLDVKNRWKVMGEEMMGDEDEDEEDIIEADLEETLDDDDIGEVEIISY
ncbi:hypothetical protein BFJ63_vAg10133 [Fusarium oxysporum f. sp. narcissi]|uniref:Uncharacterized protein n=1 Tax=Fusarium oxysporum f. sp. narcissi TaxID=451672 RepID=A0A4Q2VKZ5_FUSOX|nr:hypothetical protein BFJ63_vAg10133 [Fusarium oxysporum f. sp. narcissi]